MAISSFGSGPAISSPARQDSSSVQTKTKPDPEAQSASRGRSEEAKAAAPGQQISAQARQKAYNVEILRAHQEVSLSIKDQPQALIYKTAIEAINEELRAELGDDAIQKGYESGLDVSPEATAGRIVQFSTGLFALYKEQHPELELEEQVDRFLEVIGGGIDKGFSEARDILDGLGVLEGDIADNVDKTYDLVQEGLAAFRESLIPSTTDKSSTTDETNNSTDPTQIE